MGEGGKRRPYKLDTSRHYEGTGPQLLLSLPVSSTFLYSMSSIILCLSRLCRRQTEFFPAARAPRRWPNDGEGNAAHLSFFATLSPTISAVSPRFWQGFVAMGEDSSVLIFEPAMIHGLAHQDDPVAHRSVDQLSDPSFNVFSGVMRSSACFYITQSSPLFAAMQAILGLLCGRVAACRFPQWHCGSQYLWLQGRPASRSS